jgi:hypothetical protein
MQGEGSLTGIWHEMGVFVYCNCNCNLFASIWLHGNIRLAKTLYNIKLNTAHFT